MFVGTLTSYALAGTGGAGLITGTYFGIRTIHPRNQAVQVCSGVPCKDQKAYASITNSAPQAPFSQRVVRVK